MYSIDDLTESEITNLRLFYNWTPKEQYNFLNKLGAINNGRLNSLIKNYWQSTQTAAGGTDVTADLMQYFTGKKSDFVNYPLVLEIIKQRREDGILEWGTPLHTENGRDQAQDLEEELADAIIYLWAMKLKKQLITPRVRNLMRVLAGIHEAMELGRL
jgi:hypothetical protein